jgi:excisionase family DNA binding protein
MKNRISKKERRLRIFSALEVANICGVVNQTAINWIRNGHLKAFTTPGGQYRVYAEDLSFFLEKRGMRPTEEVLRLLFDDADWGSILVVDDDQEENNRIKQWVEKEFLQYKVFQAYDVFDAGRKLTESKPGFVFLDEDTPGVNGYTLARKIKEEPSFGRPFIIIMTEKGTLEVQRISVSWTDAFLSKPLDFDQFGMVIKNLEKRIKPANTA